MGKYTRQWWDDLSDNQQDAIAAAIDESNVTVGILDRDMKTYKDGLAGFLRDVHAYVEDLDYSVDGPWVECDLGWDGDWYVDQAVAGNTVEELDPSDYFGDVWGVVVSWNDEVVSDVSDAMRNLKTAADADGTKGREFNDAREKFLDTLEQCMTDLSGHIEYEVETFMSYYCEDVANGLIPDDIEYGSFDKVIDKYLATHEVNESHDYGDRRNLRKRVRIDGILYEAVGRDDEHLGQFGQIEYRDFGDGEEFISIYRNGAEGIKRQQSGGLFLTINTENCDDGDGDYENTRVCRIWENPYKTRDVYVLGDIAKNDPDFMQDILRFVLSLDGKRKDPWAWDDMKSLAKAVARKFGFKSFSDFKREVDPDLADYYGDGDYEDLWDDVFAGEYTFSELELY